MFPFAVDPVFTPSEGERIARDFFPFPIVFLYLSPLSASKIDFQFRKFIIHNFHPRFDHILDRIRIFSFGSLKSDLSWRGDEFDSSSRFVLERLTLDGKKRGGVKW